MTKTTYDKFVAAGEDNRRLLRQENLILDVTEAICAAMDEAGVSRSELADRLGKSKSSVSRLLCGDRNLTLRTIADLAGSLDRVVRLTIEPMAGQKQYLEPQIRRRVGWASPIREIRPSRVAFQAVSGMEGLEQYAAA